jgi:DNA-binding protein HU-beta
MNKSDIVKKIAEKEDITTEEAKRRLENVLDMIKVGLEKDEKVMISGFCSLEIVKRKEKKGRNPKTGEIIIIPPRKSIKFKIGKLLGNIL